MIKGYVAELAEAGLKRPLRVPMLEFTLGHSDRGYTALPRETSQGLMQVLLIAPGYMPVLVLVPCLAEHEMRTRQELIRNAGILVCHFTVGPDIASYALIGLRLEQNAPINYSYKFDSYYDI